MFSLLGFVSAAIISETLASAWRRDSRRPAFVDDDSQSDRPGLIEVSNERIALPAAASSIAPNAVLGRPESSPRVGC